MTAILWRTWFPTTKNTTKRTSKTIRTATTTTSPGTVEPKVLQKIQRLTLLGGDSTERSSAHFFFLKACRCYAAVTNAGAANRGTTTLTARITRYPGRSGLGTNMRRG